MDKEEERTTSQFSAVSIGVVSSRPRTSLHSPDAADHTSESGAAAAAPAPNPNSRSGDGGQQAAPAGRSADQNPVRL